MPRFADVILPLPLDGHFTYRIPEAWQESLVIGSRVIVPFGRKRFYTAIVAALHNIEPQGYEIKELSTLLDSAPVLRRPRCVSGNGLPTITSARWATSSRRPYRRD